MPIFKVQYEDSVYGGPSFLVEANDEKSAKVAGNKIADEQCRQGWSLMWIREMPPVPLAEHEEMVNGLRRHITRLEDKLSKIIDVLNDA
jgi:hypothetical protein